MKFWTAGLLFLTTAFAAAAQDLTEGLVGYYSFCGCEATDYSGNENHGTIIGDPNCIPGIKGEGFLFNENGGNTGCSTINTDFIELPTFGPIWSEGISICAWVEYENIANFERIVDIGNGSGDDGGAPVWFGREGNSDNLTLESWVSADPNANRTTGRLVAEGAITNGQIEFYCATIGGDSMKIYVNGVLVAQKAGHPILNVERTSNYIGRSNWCNADPDFHGFMDEVRIYNRALSAGEILQMYEAPFFATPPVVGICLGDSVQLRAQGGAAYEWSPSNYLSSDTVAAPMASPPVPTEYSCKIIFPDGCFITDTVLVEVDQDTMVAVDTTICANQDYYGYQTPGTYTDVFTTRYGCDSTRVLQLLVLPNVLSAEEVRICEGESYRGFRVTGIYEDTLPALTGCDTLYRLSLQVESPVFDDLAIQPADCARNNGAIQFEIGEAHRSVTASLNDAPLSTSEVSGLTPGAYALRLTDDAGCTRDTLLTVPQADCPLYVPSAFSPNGDGRNDRLRLYALPEAGITIQTFRIYNRWGSLMYEAENFAPNDSGYGWDGTYLGERLNNGTYLYTIVAVNPRGKVTTLTGDVQLVP